MNAGNPRIMPPISGGSGETEVVTPEVKPVVEPAVKPAVEVKPPLEGASWHPAEFKGHAALNKFKTPEDAIKGYVNLETAFGKKFEENLKDDAPAEVKARVRAAMGVPESPDGYEAPKPPDGFELDKNVIGGFSKVAHEAGISKGAWAKLSSAFVAMELERHTAIQAERAKEKETGMAALKQEWGAAAERNIGLCQQVVNDFGGPELKAYLNETGLGNHPKMVAFLAKMGQVLSEDNLMTPNPVGTSAEDAKKEIAAIRAAAGADRKHPYVNKDHAEHKAMLEKMARLTELAYNEV
jgi:hypothetical protein